MKQLKWLKRQKIDKIYTFPGDSIELCHNEQTIIKEVLKDNYEFDEAGVFEGKEDKKDVLGGVFIGKKIK